MKKFILYVIAQIAALGIISYLFTGFQVKGDVFTYLGIALAIAFINFFVRPLIKFLTLPINFLTFGLFNVIFAVALLYLLKTFFPVNFGAGEFHEINLGDIFVFKAFAMNQFATIIACAFSMTITSTIIEYIVGD